jgi:p-cumate 2,3-dioxygenase alpha subunit
MGERLDLGNGHVAAHFRGGWGRPVARWAPDIGAALKPEVDARWRDLVARFGPERAARMADTDRNLYIFPNLVIQDHFAVTIRTFQPLGPDRLEVTSWALAPVDESPEMRSVRLANYLTFWGPAGFATPDDIEALETAQRGFADQEVVWCDVSKGALREGSQDVEGTSADELQLRAFWRRWRSCLEAAGA